jgi:hypothetical protein
MAITLIVTAFLKLNSIQQNVNLASKADAVFTSLRVGQVQVAACSIELVAACLLLICSTSRQKAIVTLSLASMFLAYRIGLYSVGYTGPCSCLGVVNPLGLSTAAVRWISDTILALMLAYPPAVLFTGINHE